MGFFHDLEGGKNCVPAINALSGAGYIEGSSNGAVAAAGLLLVAAEVVAEVAAVLDGPAIRLSGCADTSPPWPEELSPAAL